MSRRLPHRPLAAAPPFIGLAILVLTQSVAYGDDAFFESKIRPVLLDTCFRCHGGIRTAGKLRVDSREALLRGGESGPALVPGSPDTSLLVQALRHEGDGPHMPPTKKLPERVVADFASWIKTGADWPAKTAVFKSTGTAPKHWALEPVQPVAPPAGNAAHPIDRFVLARLDSKGLKPTPPADRRTLIRRATFDLTGLPPSPEEVEAFVADEAPTAYPRLIERLLASPRYGERWGRHWLDVVRYADTAGETADYPALHAWRYRNYVIDAFNRDEPYDQFLREQIAGDILAAKPGTTPERQAQLVTATGYLAVARRFGFDVSKDHNLTIDDTIDTLGKSVLGLALGCARCHDHKYDPITAADYYALYGIFDSTRYPFPGCEKEQRPRDMVALPAPPEMRERIAHMDEAVGRCERAQKEAKEALRQLYEQTPMVQVRGDIPNGGAQEFTAGKGAEALASIKVGKGDMIQLTVLPKANHGADSTLVELEIAEVGGMRVWNATRDIMPNLYQAGSSDVWHLLDVSGEPRPFPRFEKQVLNIAGLQAWNGTEPDANVFANLNPQPVSFVTIRMPARSLALHPSPRGGVAIAWQSPVDGTVRVRGRVQDIDPTGGDGIAWTVTHRQGYSRALAEVRATGLALDQARKQRSEIPAAGGLAYAVAEGKPHNVRIHRRGDPATPGEEVPRRFLEVLGGERVPEGAGSGRLQLADWLTDARNPLTARVMVNRIWQGHFGVGLVKTPNDFGTRGEKPTHPELLDFLAARFVQEGWSIKALHRFIMLSETYQRASGRDDKNAQADPDNAYLWRFERRRLSAEEIRDAMLAVSGDLDPTPGGPHPFPPEKTWGFTQHAPFSALYDHNKRSVYLMTQRIKRHPFLALFDGADTSSSTGLRYSTTVPTQALFFLNDPFVHTRSASLADRLLVINDNGARLDQATRLLYGRPARADEAEAVARFLTRYDQPCAAWAAWLRVMLASNEFVYVD